MIDFKIEQNKIYDLNVEDLEQIYDIMVEKDCLIAFGHPYKDDVLGLHAYSSLGNHYLLIYGEYVSKRKVEYRTKRGILNRIKKHLANGDVSYSFRLFGGRDAD